MSESSSLPDMTMSQREENLMDRASHSYFLHIFFSELSGFHSSLIQGYATRAVAGVILNRGS